MTMELFLFLLAVIPGITAYALYYWDIRKSHIAPNRWSWLMWSVVTAVEVLTYHAVSGDVLTSAVFFVAAFACVIITIRIWRHAKWKRPSVTEVISVVASLAALVIWVVFHEAWWAHIVTLAAMPVAFYPTYAQAWKNWKDEDSPAWVLWTLSDFAALFYVWARATTWEEFPYAVIEVACHALVCAIVLYRGRGIRHRVHAALHWTGKSLAAIIIALFGAGFGTWVVVTTDPAENIVWGVLGVSTIAALTVLGLYATFHEQRA